MWLVPTSHSRWWLGLILIALVACPPGVLGQQAGQPGSQKLSPTEHGFRMTPGIARTLADKLTGLLVSRYQMDPDKKERAIEMLAARMMQTAHKLDGPLQELVERWLEEHFEALAQGRTKRLLPAINQVPPSFRKEFAERLSPMLPVLWGFTVDMARDVRPMLGAKQQIRLAGDLAAFQITFNAVSDSIQKWSEGGAGQDADPFQQARRQMARTTHGESDALTQCRETAQLVVERRISISWERYVRQAKEFYQFNEQQSATADSVLRESLQRVAGLLSDDAYRAQYYRNRLWYLLSWENSEGLAEVQKTLRELIERDYRNLMRPIDAIGDEMKSRIDQIPTELQRKSGEKQVESWLAEEGIGQR